MVESPSQVCGSGGGAKEAFTGAARIVVPSQFSMIWSHTFFLLASLAHRFSLSHWPELDT